MTIGYGGFESLTVFGGGGGNTFDVRATPSGTHLTLNGGAAADTFRVARSGTATSTRSATS